jgi:hypothetical protein
MIRLTILLATITIAAALATPAYAEQQWCVMTCAKGVPRGTENEEATCLRLSGLVYPHQLIGRQARMPGF